MQKDITLTQLQSLCDLLNLLKHVGLLEPVDFMITWEKKPQLTINKLGNFEFTNPQQVYGCVITFWGKPDIILSSSFSPISKTRFNITDP